MKDAKGHGSNARPIPGHPFHAKSNAELRFIAKDAAEAGRNAQQMGDQRGVSKYADQVADAATVMGYRDRGGKQDTRHPNNGLIEGMQAKLQGDIAAGRMLHSGTSKSDTAPTHDAMAGWHITREAPLGHFVNGPNGERHGPYFGARGAKKDAVRLAKLAGK